MISFIRKIRKKLIAENKFSKYLIYAIGEIILIVIGILIALGINNWNQNRIVQQKEAFYLEGLKREFELSKVKLENLMAVNKLNYQHSKEIANLIHSDNLPDENNFSKLVYRSFSNEIGFNPNNSMLIELLNSGGLEDISNPELRLHLTSWDSRIQSIKRQENTLSIQREKILDIIRSNAGSLRTILNDVGISNEIGLRKNNKNYSNITIYSSRDFENNLLMFILTSMITESEHYKPLLEEIDTIIALTENE